jgi:hypothetical protein
MVPPAAIRASEASFRQFRGCRRRGCTHARAPGVHSAAETAARQTFKDFPPIQKPNTFTLDQALTAMHETAAGMH